MPGSECPWCPRLVEFRQSARARQPDWHNAPVDNFGTDDAVLLIVGLAPGLAGANRTGRPFTGDYAGDLLYQLLLDYGFARGVYGRDAADGLRLQNSMITNAVRCVPPANKPTPAEIKTCRGFLAATISALPRLKAVLALGRIAHESVVRVSGEALARAPFQHGRRHRLAGPTGHIVLFDSYHCSRYNVNTGVLTAGMFRTVFEDITLYLTSEAEHHSA